MELSEVVACRKTCFDPRISKLWTKHVFTAPLWYWQTLLLIHIVLVKHLFVNAIFLFYNISHRFGLF